jgi:hypothetical protein
LDSVSLFVPETLCFPFVFGGKIIFAYLSDLVPSGLPDIAISSSVQTIVFLQTSSMRV